MNDTPETPKPKSPEPDASAARGADDRRGAVNPADDPAPRSPERDDEATRLAEDILERIKPY